MFNGWNSPLMVGLSSFRRSRTLDSDATWGGVNKPKGCTTFFELSDIPIEQEKEPIPLQHRFPVSAWSYPPIFTMEHHCGWDQLKPKPIIYSPKHKNTDGCQSLSQNNGPRPIHYCSKQTNQDQFTTYSRYKKVKMKNKPIIANPKAKSEENKPKNQNSKANCKEFVNPIFSRQFLMIFV